MNNRKPRAAAIYARISHDPSRERLGVKRQEADCRLEAQRRGWQLGDVYIDDDFSAFNPRTRRPEYQRLLRDIGSGLIDGVLIWRLDRLHRQPKELEEFITLCDRHHVALATVAGDIDLSTSQGRFIARTIGAFAAHESEVRGERLSRAAKDRATRGRMYVPTRPYGYTKDGLTVKPHEAHVIHEAAHRVLAGDSLRGIVVDFNSRHIVTSKGGPWQAPTLRRMLLNPRIAGLSTFHHEVVGRGCWKPILSRSVSERVRLVLTDPARRSSHEHFHTNLLRGFVRCGRCKTLMHMGGSTGHRQLRCPKNPGNNGCGRVYIARQALEHELLGQLCVHLSATLVSGSHGVSSPYAQQLRRLTVRTQHAERELERIARDYASSLITRGEWLAARKVLAQRARSGRATFEATQTNAIVADYAGRPARLREQWPTLHSDRRRAIALALLECVFVLPARSPGWSEAPHRLLYWWRGEPKPRMPRGSLTGIRERREMGSYERCSVAGCEEPYRANGYCNVHLCRLHDRGDLGGAERIRHAPYHGILCCELECDRRAAVRGLCNMHYLRWQTRDPGRPLCAETGCDHAAIARSRCWKHYRLSVRSERPPDTRRR